MYMNTLLWSTLIKRLKETEETKTDILVSNYEKTIEINLLKIEGEIGSGKNKCGRVKHTAFFSRRKNHLELCMCRLH